MRILNVPGSVALPGDQQSGCPTNRKERAKIAKVGNALIPPGLWRVARCDRQWEGGRHSDIS